MVAGVDIQAVITQAAQALGVDPKLALAIAQQESGFDPQAVGDGGTSFGLFQLHQGGELGSYSPQQVMDNPYLNATIALTQVAAIAKANPSWTPGQIAAAAQRPADQVGYAAAINANYQAANFGSGIGTAGSGGGAAGSSTISPALQSVPNAGATLDPTYYQMQWAINDPEIGPLLKTYAQNQDAAAFQSGLEQTTWFKTHNDAAQSWIELQHNDPAEAQSRIQQQTLDIHKAAKLMGVIIPDTIASQIATDALSLGWSQAEIQQNLSNRLNPTVPQAGDAGAEAQTLRAFASSMLLPISDTQINQWADQVVGGSADEKGIQAQMTQQALSLYKDPNLDAAIKNGQTVAAYYDSYKQLAAQTLNIDPNTINLMDPKWLSAFTQTDPQTKINSSISLGDWQRKLMTDPSYGYQYTRTAKDAAAAAAQTIGRMFGQTTGGTTLPALGV